MRMKVFIFVVFLICFATSNLESLFGRVTRNKDTGETYVDQQSVSQRDPSSKVVNIMDHIPQSQRLSEEVHRGEVDEITPEEFSNRNLQQIREQAISTNAPTKATTEAPTFSLCDTNGNGGVSGKEARRCSYSPSVSPTTAVPSVSPTTAVPSVSPTTAAPSFSFAPSRQQTVNPTVVFLSPTFVPTFVASYVPTMQPTKIPTRPPSQIPTSTSSQIPTSPPSQIPTTTPTLAPTEIPTRVPSEKPTKPPTAIPSVLPTKAPTVVPTRFPTERPSKSPSAEPSLRPTFVPTEKPSRAPTQIPTVRPTLDPTVRPSIVPTMEPSVRPSREPTSLRPTFETTMKPSRKPTASPTVKLTASPSTKAPSVIPSIRPTRNPTYVPTRKPTFIITRKPTNTPKPTRRVISDDGDHGSQGSRDDDDFDFFDGSTGGNGNKRTRKPKSTRSPSKFKRKRKPAPQPGRTKSPTTGDYSDSGDTSGSNSIDSWDGGDDAWTYADDDYSFGSSVSRKPSVVPTITPTAPTVYPTMEDDYDDHSDSSYDSTPDGSLRSRRPSRCPTVAPTSEAPTLRPSRRPTTSSPSEIPTLAPSEVPTVVPSENPSESPTFGPTVKPSRIPTFRPSRKPTEAPTTGVPSEEPTFKPSVSPTIIPSARPSWEPTIGDTDEPSVAPSKGPSWKPSIRPTKEPSVYPTFNPTADPTEKPSVPPSESPSVRPTLSPTEKPSREPTESPTVRPTRIPTANPTESPTVVPSVRPTTMKPSQRPTESPSTQRPTTPEPTYTATSEAPIIGSHSPSRFPTLKPSFEPSMIPTSRPTDLPTARPTSSPSTSIPTSHPSSSPSQIPRAEPTSHPSSSPSSLPTILPTSVPTEIPTSFPTANPTAHPTSSPSHIPSSFPSSLPTNVPTSVPTEFPTSLPTSHPTSAPTMIPTSMPTMTPTTSLPTSFPTSFPTALPTVIPSSFPTASPTPIPTEEPTEEPTQEPTEEPTEEPTIRPTRKPSKTPTMDPTPDPTSNPSITPTSHPTNIPKSNPSSIPTKQPISTPTSKPSSEPTSVPSAKPSSEPTSVPSSKPSSEPTSVPSAKPSSEPTSVPSAKPSSEPTSVPSAKPSSEPTSVPSAKPSSEPTSVPSSKPSSEPTSVPSAKPSSEPTSVPSAKPSSEPTSVPSAKPSSEPTSVPSSKPSSEPTSVPSSKPSSEPTSVPSAKPSSEPTSVPSAKPSSEPTSVPSSKPSWHATDIPTIVPSVFPSVAPSMVPSVVPSVPPSLVPSVVPSVVRTISPSAIPSVMPSFKNVSVVCSSGCGSNQCCCDNGSGAGLCVDNVYGTSDCTAACGNARCAYNGQSSKGSFRHCYCLKNCNGNNCNAIGGGGGACPGKSVCCCADNADGVNYRGTTTYGSVCTNCDSSIPGGWITAAQCTYDVNDRKPTIAPTRQPSFASSVVPSISPSQKPSIVPSATPSVQPSTTMPTNSNQYNQCNPGCGSSQCCCDNGSGVGVCIDNVYGTSDCLVACGNARCAYKGITSANQYRHCYCLKNCNGNDCNAISGGGGTCSGSSVCCCADNAEAAGYQGVTAFSSVCTNCDTSTAYGWVTAAQCSFDINDRTPTVAPSRLPTVLPTVTSTKVPSVSPSMVPSIISTAIPSTAGPTTRTNPHKPTTVPTMYPTMKPTSAKPSVTPTTFAPTVSHTAVPSANPSAYPSSRPTSKPSSYEYFCSSLENSTRADEFMNYVSHRSYGYNSMSYKFETTVGGCSAWNAFVKFALSVEATASTANSVSMFTTGDIQQSKPSLVTCASASNASMILEALRSGTTTSVSVDCDGYSWKVNTCDGSLAVCVNCNNPCSKDISYANPFMYKPCATSPNMPVTTFLRVDVTTDFPVPCVLDSKVEVSRDSAEIHLDMSSRGQVFCAAYASDTNDVTLASIISQRYDTKAVPRQDTTVVIEGLRPDTDYSFFCVGGGLNAQAVSVANDQFTANSVKSSTFRTSCCNQITISFDLISVPVGFIVGTKSFTVGIKHAPATEISVRVEAVKRSGGQELVVSVSDFIFSPSNFGSRAVNWPTMAFQSSGELYLRATTLSTDVSIEFERMRDSVVGITSGYYTVCNTTVPILTQAAVPIPMYAAYLTNGRRFAIRFSQDVDISAYKYSDFSCAGIVETVVDLNAVLTCTWSNEYTLSVFSSKLLLDVKIRVLPSSLLAKCSLASCSPLYVEEGILTVQGPSVRKMLPIVSAIGPTMVSEDTDVIIDISPSTGSFGWGWTKVEVAVYGAVSTVNERLESYLASFSYDNIPILLPREYVLAGSYVFEVRLCNAFLACSSGYYKLYVVKNSVPHMLIGGPAVRNVKASTELRLQGAAAMLNIQDGRIVTNSTAKSFWMVKRNGVILRSNGVAGANEAGPTHLKVTPYSLPVGQMFQVSLIMEDPITRGLNVYSQQINVVSGNLVAIIGGAENIVLTARRSVTLDGSYSYDENLNRSLVTGQAAGLHFTWSCQTLNRTSCALQVLSIDLAQETLQLRAPLNSLDSVNYITMAITDHSGRIAQSVVKVTVVQANTPLVTLSNVNHGGIKSYSSLEYLTLLAKVEIDHAGSFTWSVNDSTVDLSAVALSPVSVLHSEPSVAMMYTLVIPVSSLTKGNYLSFSLSFTDVANNVWSDLSSITVSINSGPQGGSFVVAPSSGRSIEDLFHFSTYDWVAEDMPMFFSYNYLPIDDYDVSYPAQLESEFTQAYVRLSYFGSSAVIYTAQVVVVDALSAMSTLTQEVELTSSNLDVSLSLDMFALPGDVRSRMSVVYTTLPSNAELHYQNARLQQLNAQLCSASAVDCGVLHRESCSSHTGTCGSCLSGYSSYSADINTACEVSEDIVSSVAVVAKQCPNACSGHGTCTFVSATGNSASMCLLDSFGCTTVCSCSSGFVGDACQFTSTLQSNQSVAREKLLSDWMDLVTSSVAYTDALSLTLWSTLWLSVNGAIIQSELLDSASLPSKVYPFAKYLLEHSSYLQYDSTSMTMIDTIISAVETSNSVSSVDSWLLQNIVSDQSIVQLVNDKKSAAFGKGYATVDRPVKVATTSAAGAVLAEASVSSVAASSSVGVPVSVSMQVFADPVVQGVWNRTSLPARVLVQGEISSIRSAVLTISNDQPVQYDEPEIEIVNVACDRGVATPAVVECASMTKTVVCPSLFIGNITLSCPYTQLRPTCHVLNEFIPTGQTCTVLDFDSYATRCECSLQSSASAMVSSVQGSVSTVNNILSKDVVVSVGTQSFDILYMFNSSRDSTYVSGDFPQFDLVVKTTLIFDGIDPVLLSTPAAIEWVNSSFRAMLPSDMISIMSVLNFTEFVPKYHTMNVLTFLQDNTAEPNGGVSVSMESWIRTNDFCNLNEVMIVWDNALNETASLSVMQWFDAEPALHNVTYVYSYSYLYSYKKMDTLSSYCKTGISSLASASLPSAQTVKEDAQKSTKDWVFWQESHAFWQIAAFCAVSITLVMLSVAYGILSNRHRHVLKQLPVEAPTVGAVEALPSPHL